MFRPKEKKERALGVHLHLKGERCAGPKCAMVRRPYPPGVHGQTRSRKRSPSEFGLQLREKQKFKFTYGVNDKNLKNAFKKASRAKGSSSSGLMELLERRLDNVVFRLGFVASRSSARQFVMHGHVTVNGIKVRSPGYLVKKDNIVGLRVGSEKGHLISQRKEIIKKYEIPSWLELDREKLQGKIVSLPQNVESPFEIKLLVEAFSK